MKECPSGLLNSCPDYDEMVGGTILLIYGAWHSPTGMPAVSMFYAYCRYNVTNLNENISEREVLSRV